jgi:hypothetical protein
MTVQWSLSDWIFGLAFVGLGFVYGCAMVIE